VWLGPSHKPAQLVRIRSRRCILAVRASAGRERSLYEVPQNTLMFASKGFTVAIHLVSSQIVGMEHSVRVVRCWHHASLPGSCFVLLWRPSTARRGEATIHNATSGHLGTESPLKCWSELNVFRIREMSGYPRSDGQQDTRTLFGQSPTVHYSLAERWAPQYGAHD